MAVYRGGYGLANYGAYSFGLDGSILAAAATVVTVVSAVSTPIRIRLTSATDAANITSTASG
jgi:hypothetical protein